ncbi:uncharacterized protein [Cherax quadricarinatus]|uniref:uncharacterized protein n=1 Tax=Cherax quadricarinatus TaxID=27406 RepID=UPI00387EC9B9
MLFSDALHPGSLTLTPFPCHQPSQDTTDIKFLTHDDLIKDQFVDQSLERLRDIAITESEAKDLDNCYCYSNGVLMEKNTCTCKLSADSVSTTVKHFVVLPVTFREQALDFAHNSLIGGHLGVKKTLGKLAKHFTWPKMKETVADHVRRCHVCQVTGKPVHTPPPAPLIPITVDGEPFSRLIIDCVGPLPRTKLGNQYLFTIMDAATCYPKAIPMRKINARAIVRALMKFFSQVGLPQEIQSDQGSNFTSKIFREALSHLGIKSVLSTSYHPQSQGALERFHQTLKSMVRAYCEHFYRDWDEGIPFLLFAMRESEQESLGFSLFELIFGHQVRGPLAVLKDAWTGKSNPSLSSSPSLMQQHLTAARELASKNLVSAQDKMKQNYDKRAVSRSFKAGDKVMAQKLVPGHALQARYDGPLEVVRKLSDINYLVCTPGKRKSNHVYHVNQLKKYYASVLPTTSILPRTEEENVSLPDISRGIEVHLENSVTLQSLDNFLSNLGDDKAGDIKNMILQFPELYSDVPKHCTLGVHDIDVQGASPIKQSPYRMSPTKHKALREEVDFLLSHGLIERSKSPWASPCILVPKPDGSFRMCTDYRKVNSVTLPDGYPLPHIDDLIDRVSGAQFVSRLDLLRGYYQVPLTECAQEISVFTIQDGLFNYLVTPFGLCNAASSFQRIMNELTHNLEGVEAYLDDLVVYSDEWE